MIAAAITATGAAIHAPRRTPALAQPRSVASASTPMPQIAVSSWRLISACGTPALSARSCADSPLKYAAPAPASARERRTGPNQRSHSFLRIA